MRISDWSSTCALPIFLQANGLTSFNLNRNLNDIVQREPQRTVQNLYRFVGGVEGHFDVAGERWNWDISYNYGRVRNNSRVTYVDPDRFPAAVNAVEGPGGWIVGGGGAERKRLGWGNSG